MSRHRAVVGSGGRRLEVVVGWDGGLGGFFLDVPGLNLERETESGTPNIYESTADLRLTRGRGGPGRPYLGLGADELMLKLTELCVTPPAGVLQLVMQGGVEDVRSGTRHWKEET